MQDLKNIKLFLLDMDGTIYLGSTLFEKVNETLDVMRAQGKICFLTNNSSRSIEDYMVRLTNFGVRVQEGEVYTSGVAAAEYLLEKHGKCKLCAIASESYKKELLSFGFEITEDEPDVVLVAFDLNMTYNDIYRACKWIRLGKPYYTTHPDTNCPNDDAPLPDVGSLMEMIATSTGRYPDLVCGKPNAPILDGVMKRLNAKKEETAMVGDRLNTDILFGVKNGITSVCVMTGDTTYEMLEESQIKPDYVLENFAQFMTILKK